MSCMANADFAFTSGVLGLAGARFGIKRRWSGARRPAADERETVVASLHDDEDAHRVPAER